LLLEDPKALEFQEAQDVEEPEDWQAGDDGSEQEWVSESALTPNSRNIAAEAEVSRYPP